MAVHGGEGTLLSYEGSAIGQRTTITGPSREVAEIETTNLDSTATEWRPGLPTSGTVTFEIEFDPGSAAHTTLEGLAATPAVGTWELEFSDGSTRTFEGFLTSFETSGMEVGGNLVASVTVRITGGIVAAAGGA